MNRLPIYPDSREFEYIIMVASDRRDVWWQHRVVQRKEYGE